MNEAGADIRKTRRGAMEGEGPWAGLPLRTCQYIRESQGSGLIRVRRPRRTIGRTYAGLLLFLFVFVSLAKGHLLLPRHLQGVTFGSSNLLVLELGFERKEEMAFLAYVP